MASECVTVELGDRSYPIVFDALSRLGSSLLSARGGSPGKCVLVTNDVVGPLHGAAARESLAAAGWAPEYVELPDGESQKTADTYLWLVTKLLDLQVDRRTPVIALGGGVTTDIVGFAAATTLRGLPFANVPTSLLAQVDASVGGKTGVNTAHGKNLLGAFWQPFLVHIAVETLATLSGPEFRCGLGEVVKHAVLEEAVDPADATKLVPSTVFFEWLETNCDAVAAREPAALLHTIRRCCEIKAAVVSADEREAGKRELLNLGHTVGHAIESVVGYGGLRHGEAVAMGTVAETQLAVLRGYCDAALPARISRLLEALQLPTGLQGLEVDALVQASLSDKKRRDTHISVTMPHAIGDVRLVKITPDELRPAFEALGAAAGAAAGTAAGTAADNAGPSPLSVAPPTDTAGVVAPELVNKGKGKARGVCNDTQSAMAAPFALDAPENKAAGDASGKASGKASPTRVSQPPGGASSIVFG